MMAGEPRFVHGHAAFHLASSGTCQAVVSVAGDVAVHHVQQHAEAQPVRLIYQRLRASKPPEM